MGSGEILRLVLNLVPALVYVALVQWVAREARRQGRSHNVFLALSLFLTPLAGVVILKLVGDNWVNDGHVVFTLQRTELADGTVLRRKFVARVTATKSIDGTAVVQVASPTGLVWIARDNVRKARSIDTQTSVAA